MSRARRHVCAMLKYRNYYLEQCDTLEGSRWRLILQKYSSGPNDNDIVLLDNVMFCPWCGKAGGTSRRAVRDAEGES